MISIVCVVYTNKQTCNPQQVKCGVEKRIDWSTIECSGDRNSVKKSKFNYIWKELKALLRNKKKTLVAINSSSYEFHNIAGRKINYFTCVCEKMLEIIKISIVHL